MKMRQLSTLGILLLSIIIFASCSFNITRGNGTIVSNEVDIQDYNQLHMSGSGNIIYEQNEDAKPYLRIEIDENLFPLLLIESKDATLAIGTARGENIDPTEFNVYTNSTDLVKLNLSGSSTLQLKDKMIGDNLEVDISGSVKLIVDSILYNSVDIKVSGMGDINMIGKVGKSAYSIAGSSNIDAVKMLSDSVACSISGSADIKVHAVELLDVKISGSSTVKYKGSPRVTQSISGSGNISSIE